MNATPDWIRIRERGALERFARGGRQAAAEHCDLCATVIPARHRHLLNVRAGEIQCVCQACSLLFAGDVAGDLRLIGDRRISVGGGDDFERAWGSLRIPVDMAFIVRHSDSGPAAHYPSPAGATRFVLAEEGYQRLASSSPDIACMKPDIEALLVSRVRRARRQFIVPIDDCFRLVASVRTQWRGISGGEQVRREVESFFTELEKISRPGSASEATTVPGQEESLK